MTTTRYLATLAIFASLAGPVRAQATNDPEAKEPWSFSATASAYFVPDDPDFVLPVFTADHAWLHLEARYNYEAQKTGSVWAGYNLSGGEKVTVEATLMAGVVFGDTRGVAPGCEITVDYKGLEFYTEGEWLIDADDSSNNFVYLWSQLTYSPVEWFRTGLVTQRTRAYQTDLDVQRGFLIGFSFKKLTLTTDVFNIGWTDPTVVVSLGGEF